MIESFTGLKVKIDELFAKDIVGANAKLQNGLTIMGCGVNGSALTVNGGEITANYGVVSHTANNRFQTMQIFGGGPNYTKPCFVVDKGVDSLMKGDVTIQDANLILDKSKLITDDIIVTSLEQTDYDNPTMGVRLTTDTNWNTYMDSMVREVDCSNDGGVDDSYDPYASVQDAINRNSINY